MTVVPSTDELVADLRRWTLPASSRTWPHAEAAADRLADLQTTVDALDAELLAMQEANPFRRRVNELAAQLDAVNAALDQYDYEVRDAPDRGISAAFKCRSAVAEAVGR